MQSCTIIHLHMPTNQTCTTYGVMPFVMFRLAKTEESNYSNSLSTFQESVHATNQEHNDGKTVEHNQVCTMLIQLIKLLFIYRQLLIWNKVTSAVMLSYGNNCVIEVLSPAESTNYFRSLYQQCVESDKNVQLLLHSNGCHLLLSGRTTVCSTNWSYQEARGHIDY